MGFLKRLFSLSSRRGKNERSQPRNLPLEPTPELREQLVDEQDQEAAVTRLLRSSSTHFSVVSEVDYASLPPIPHPINTVAQTPTASPSRSAGLQRKGTYTVTVHGRTHHSHTEFPNAYPPLHDPPATPEHDHRNERGSGNPQHRHVPDPRKVPVTPRDQNRLNRLRQDPSVVSLLNMYDEQGCLDDKAFSNTPPPAPSVLSSKSGARPRKKRRQSTLRELLGDGEEAGFGGEIAWAERYLGEHSPSTSSLSTTSSSGLNTPTAAHFQTGTYPTETPTKNKSFSSGNSSSTCNHPFISSLEVELSAIMDVDDSPIPDEGVKPAYQFRRTPSQRASQVFDFLSEKRDKRPRARTLPMLPNPNRDGTITDSVSYPPATPDSYSEQAQILYPMPNCQSTPLPARRLAELDLPTPPPPPPTPYVFMPLKPPPLRTKARSLGAADALKMGPRVRSASISTSRLSVAGTEHEYIYNMKGPRLHTSSNIKALHEDRRALGTLTNATDDGARVLPARPHTLYSKFESGPSEQPIDPFTPEPARVSHYSSSRPSQIPKLNIEADPKKPVVPVIARVPERTLRGEKENAGKRLSENRRVSAQGLEGKHMYTAPVRTHGTQSPHDNFGSSAPSPASSSELSPEAKQMMSDLRTKRLRAATQRRRKGGTRKELISA